MTCGGGCCSSGVANKPATPPRVPSPAIVDEPIDPTLPIKPEPERSNSSRNDIDTTCSYVPAPESGDKSAPQSDTCEPKVPSKSSCRAPCCGGKEDNRKTLPELSEVVPALPVNGSSDEHESASPGPSSCKASICDDECCKAEPISKQDFNDEDSTHGRRLLTLSIQGMDCPGCSPRVVRALTSFSSVADCHVDVFAGRATVTYHPNKAQPDEMVRHLAASTGFQCQIEDDHIVGKEMRRMRIQLGRPLDGEYPKLQGVKVLEEKLSHLIQVEYDTHMNPRDVLTSFSSWDGVYVPLAPEFDVGWARREVFRLLYLTGFSAILTLPILVLAWTPLPPRPTTYGAVSLAMTSIIQIVVARPIYVSGIRALLFQHTIDMDVLVSISIGTAYVFSTVAYACMVAGRPIKDGESYFETAALLVTLVMLGRLIAAYARRRSTDAVAKLGSIQSHEATLVETSNGLVKTRVIPIGLVHIGDIIRIVPGELIPTDGRVVDGEGYVDESSITGESAPVIKATGAVLVAGTAIISSSPVQSHVDMRVTVIPTSNTIARMTELMRTAQSARLRIQDTTDRVAGWLAPTALTIALVAFLGWVGVGVRDAYKLGGSDRTDGIQKAVVNAIGYTVAIMVVSCPCALALCVPMVAVIAVAVGTRRGVLFKSVEALETACNVKVVVFDKTGTLTLGKLSIESSTYHCQNDVPWANYDQGIQHAIRDLTESSTHPVALAVHEHLSGLVPSTVPAMFKASDVQSVPGKGLEVTLDEYIIRGGNVAWAAGDGAVTSTSGDHTVFVVSVASNSSHPKFTRIAYYTLSDSLRPDSLKAVRKLINRGLEVHILSGDAPGVVAQTAEALGIPASQARGGCSPEEKAQWIRFLQTGGMSDGECGTEVCTSTPISALDRTRNSTASVRKVMFIGDGTNDALALVQSDVSISMGSGTDIASSAANVVLLSSLSTGMSTVFTLARAARTRIWINFGWAFVYNVVAILMASGVLGSVRIPPEWAGLGELVSVLPVVLIAWSLGLVQW